MSEEYNTNINTQGSDPEKEQETTAVQEEKKENSTETGMEPEKHLQQKIPTMHTPIKEMQKTKKRKKKCLQRTAAHRIQIRVMELQETVRQNPAIQKMKIPGQTVQVHSIRERRKGLTVPIISALYLQSQRVKNSRKNQWQWAKNSVCWLRQQQFLELWQAALSRL